MRLLPRPPIRKEMVYPFPPKRVWTALTDRHALAEWLMPNDFEPVAGHRFRFQYDPNGLCPDGLVECEVLEIDPPRRMVWSWVHASLDPSRPRPPASRVTWTLAPEGAGTRLRLEHTDLESERWLIATMMRFGWGYMLKRLIPKVLENVGSAAPFGYTPGAIPLEKRGYRCKTIDPALTR